MIWLRVLVGLAGAGWGSPDPLRQWLGNATVDSQLDGASFRCTGLGLDRLHSDRPPNGTGLTVVTQMTGLRASCQVALNGTGRVSFEVARASSAVAAVAFSSSGQPIRLAQCAVHVQITGLRASGLGVLGLAIDLLHARIERLLQAWLDKAVCQRIARQLAAWSDLLNQFIHARSGPPVSVRLPTDRELLEWRNVPLLAALPAAEQLASIARSWLGHIWSWTGLGPTVNLGGVTLGLDSLAMKGINTLNSLTLLQPAAAESHSLSARLNQSCAEVQAGVAIAMPNSSWRLSLNVSANVSSIDARAQALIALDRRLVHVDRLLGKGLSYLGEATVALNVTQMVLNATIDSLVLGPTVGHGLLASVAQVANLHFAAFGQSGGWAPALNLLNFQLNGTVRPQLDQAIRAAIDKLPPYAPEQSPTDETAAHAAIWAGSLTGGCIVVVVMLYWRGWLVSAKPKPQIDTSSEDVDVLLLSPEAKESDRCVASGYKQHSWLQLLMPIHILILLGVCGWTHAQDVCEVILRVTGGLDDPAQHTIDDTLIRYSYVELVHDFWLSGAWYISLMIVLGSSVVPVSKAVIQLLFWLCPANATRRGWLLLGLDILGRVFFTDVFYLIPLVIVLHTHAELPGTTLDLLVRPQVGFTVLAYSAVAMMLSSALTIQCHVRLFAVEHNSNTTASNGRLASSVALLLLASSAVCFAMTFNGELTVLELDGLLGQASALIGNSQKKPISLASPIYEFPLDTDAKTSAYTLLVVYVVVSIIAPACFLLAAALVWSSAFFPALQRHTWRLRLQQVLPYLYSWVAYDVLWLAQVGIVFEFDLTAQFIVRQQAEQLCSQLKGFVGQPCLKVNGSFGPASWWTLGAAISFACLFVWSCRYHGLPVLNHKGLL